MVAQLAGPCVWLSPFTSPLEPSACPFAKVAISSALSAALEQEQEEEEEKEEEE